MRFQGFGSELLQFSPLTSGACNPGIRTDERRAERVRIAQDLHDTILQGFLAVSMQMHAAIDLLHSDTPAKPRFSNLLQVMDRVLEEARLAVQGLRSSSSDSQSLAEAFAAIPSELGLRSNVEYQVRVLGKLRELNESLREDLYRIGREAVINAFRHSNASNVQVQIEYRANYLRIAVQDNGSGMNSQVARTGRQGHWGLSGMKERAIRIGAQLRILSRAGVGTQVALSVPARIAFEADHDGLRARWPTAFPYDPGKSQGSTFGQGMLDA